MRYGPALAVSLVILTTTSVAPAARQQPLPSPAIEADEAAGVGAGWSLLAEGRAGEAGALAAQLMGRYPKSVGVLALAVESALAGGAAVTGLDVYEQWLGSRVVEEPGVLRRIARATLYEWAGQSDDTRARVEALKALNAEGERLAGQALLGSAVEGSVQDIRALAVAGHEQAFDRIVERMQATSGVKAPEIQTLEDSGNPRAVAPLVAVLGDPLPENRAAAARALGELGQREAVTPLYRALEDANGGVRIEAAGALLKLGDFSGMSLLQELATSEHAAVRRSAAWLLKSQPDAAWQALVRGLATDPDPATRLDAGKLIAPYDPELSRALFASLSASQNPAIRDATAVAVAEAPNTTFPALRAILRTGSPLARVSAADRILTLTR